MTKNSSINSPRVKLANAIMSGLKRTAGGALKGGLVGGATGLGLGGVALFDGIVKAKNIQNMVRSGSPLPEGISDALYHANLDMSGIINKGNIPNETWLNLRGLHGSKDVGGLAKIFEESLENHGDELLSDAIDSFGIGGAAIGGAMAALRKRKQRAI